MLREDPDFRNILVSCKRTLHDYGYEGGCLLYGSGPRNLGSKTPFLLDGPYFRLEIGPELENIGFSTRSKFYLEWRLLILQAKWREGREKELSYMSIALIHPM